MARFIVEAGLSNDMHWARREPSEFVLNQASNLLRESTHACSGSFGTENLPPRVEYAAFRGRTGIVNRLAWCEPAYGYELFGATGQPSDAHGQAWDEVQTHTGVTQMTTEGGAHDSLDC